MKKSLFKILSAASISVFMWNGLARASYAVGTINDLLSGSPIGSPGLIPGIIRGIFQIAFSVAGVATLGMIIYGGFLYIFAEGDAQKTATAQKTIINGVMGLIIVSISVLLFNFVVTQILKVPISVFELNL